MNRIMNPANRTLLERTGGFTLIELVVAMALSSVVMIFLFGVHYQTSESLRGFAKAGEHTDGIIAARDMISDSVRSAGRYLPAAGLRVSLNAGTANWAASLEDFVQCQPSATTGVCASSPTYKLIRQVSARNGGPGATPLDNSDQLFIIRGKTEPVAGFPSTAGQLIFTSATAGAAAFAASNGLVAVVSSTGTFGCVVQLGPQVAASSPRAALTAAQLASAIAYTISSSHPVNAGMAAADCGLDQANVSVVPLESEWFGLDASNDQLRFTNDLGQINAATSSVLGVGFTNLQFAIRFNEPSDATATCSGVPNSCDGDVDGDKLRDWYSGNQGSDKSLSNIGNLSGSPRAGRPADGVPIAVGVTIERRSRIISGVSSLATAALARQGVAGQPGQKFNNSFGDFLYNGPCPAGGPSPCGTSLMVASDYRYIPSGNLDPDNNGSNDGMPFLYHATSTVIALRSAGGAM
jgi:prepilin-type N-terminal cleavage/methylation domain-containing protein